VATEGLDVVAGAWAASFGGCVDGLRADRGLPPVVGAKLAETAALVEADEPAAAIGPGDVPALVGEGFAALAAVEVGDERAWTWRDGAARFGVVVGERMRAIAVGGVDGRGAMWGVCVALFGPQPGRGSAALAGRDRGSPGAGEAGGRPSVATAGR
jgi:hypothetical protein